MIKIFNATDKIFSSNGNIAINPLKCIETKKKSLNGWYVDVEIPIKHKDDIVQDMLCVVKTKSKLNPQAFRIKNISYTQRKVVFQAEHVMFDARDYFLLDVRPTNLSGLGALTYINERTDNISPFIIYSDIEAISTSYFIRKNLLEAWTIIEERYNGIFDADNWDISFTQNIGLDRGEIIAYGKNLQSIKVFEDWVNVVTKLYPVGKDGLLLPEKFIESETQYEKPYTKTITFESSLEEEEQTEENLIIELRSKAISYIEINQFPMVSYEISSVINQQMEIGDKIHVKHPLVNLLTEVLEYENDTISKRIKKIIFGNFTRDVKAKFDSIRDEIKQNTSKLSKQEIAINEQTNIINSLNKLGNVYIDENEILILDVLPKDQAQYVLRIGLGGFGFSSTGYEGPFEFAFTQDGQINANLITTGQMSLSRITGLNDRLSNIDLGISNITSTVSDLNNKTNVLEENVEGLTNTMKETGGLNALPNSVGYDGDEYWEGPVVSANNTDIQDNTRADIAFKLQNGIMSQTISIQNGTYTLSGLSKKLLELANIRLNINDVDIPLNDVNWKQFIYTFEVNSRSITIKLISDTDNAGYVSDLMINSGDLPQVWSLNQNETHTDTVQIGKGIKINASGVDTQFDAGADGIRIRNKTTNAVSTEFTTEGTKTDKLTAQSSLVAGLLTQRINGQVCMNNIGGVL